MNRQIRLKIVRKQRGIRYGAVKRMACAAFTRKVTSAGSSLWMMSAMVIVGKTRKKKKKQHVRALTFILLAEERQRVSAASQHLCLAAQPFACAPPQRSSAARPTTTAAVGLLCNRQALNVRRSLPFYIYFYTFAIYQWNVLCVDVKSSRQVQQTPPTRRSIDPGQEKCLVLFLKAFPYDCSWLGACCARTPEDLLAYYGGEAAARARSLSRTPPPHSIDPCTIYTPRSRAPETLLALRLIRHWDTWCDRCLLTWGKKSTTFDYQTEAIYKCIRENNFYSIILNWHDTLRCVDEFQFYSMPSSLLWIKSRGLL